MKKWLVLLSISITLMGCQNTESEGEFLSQANQLASPNKQKKVIVVIIDSMTKPIIDQGLKQGALPALSFLIENGSIYHDLVAPFPSMSVTIESTLLTGASPSEHRLPGLTWYDRNSDTLIDYGATIGRTVKLGARDVLMNGLIHLNNDHLSPKTETVFEALQSENYTTGSVNMLVYRGNNSHGVTVPAYMQQILNLEENLYTKGPDLLSLGQVIKPKILQGNNSSQGLFHKYGVNDEYSATVVSSLIKENQQPDFLMTFFPNFDKNAHRRGPENLEDFAKTDQALQQIFNSFESWEKALEETTFIIMGDHGQNKIVANKADALINLEPLIEPYKAASLLDEPSSGDIIIANNHRMAYLYPVNKSLTFHAIKDLLLQDSRIDHLAWLEGEELIIFQGGEDGVLRVKEQGIWTDRYGQSWSLTGNTAIADIETLSSSIIYKDYPDLFHQLFEALKSHDSPMIVTAKPGHSLYTEGAPVHIDGGEHGGLHKTDTLTSIIISSKTMIPYKRRMEDLKPYFQSLFNEE